MDSFLFAFHALAPLLVLALIGYFLRAKFLSDEFIVHLNRYIFYVALPVLIFVTIADMEGITQIAWEVIVFAVLSIFVVTLLAYAFLRWRNTASRERPVLLQAFFRGNFVLIGFPLVMRIGGVDSLRNLVILNAFLVPIANFGSILVFRLNGSSGRFSMNAFMDLMKTTMKNPLMVAIFAGLVAFALRAPLGGVFEDAVVVPDTLDLISDTATPMALIAVGGQFRVERVKAFLNPILISVIGRLIVVPIVVFLVAYSLRTIIPFENSWAALIALFASPVAISSVAVTQGLDGDEELASQIVIWTTATAVFTLFIFVAVFRAAGLL